MNTQEQPSSSFDKVNRIRLLSVEYLYSITVDLRFLCHCPPDICVLDFSKRRYKNRFVDGLVQRKNPISYWYKTESSKQN